MVDVADSKSADGDIVWVRVPPPAPRQKKAAPFRLPGLRKSREDYTSAASFFLSETELSRGSSVSVLEDVWICLLHHKGTRGFIPLSLYDYRLGDSNPRALGDMPGTCRNPRWPVPQDRSSPATGTTSEEANCTPLPLGRRKLRIRWLLLPFQLGGLTGDLRVGIYGFGFGGHSD